MSEIQQGPHLDFVRPQIELPAGSCDSHVHLYGPRSRFPYDEKRGFTPPEAPVEILRDLHATLGFQRSVLVQSAAHGSDHRVLLDAMARFPGEYRAVALLPDGVTNEELVRLDRAGFCGARIHFAPHLGAPPSREAVARIVDTIGPLGWHLEVHTMHSGIHTFADMVSDLPIRVVLDHMGRFDMPEDSADLEAHESFRLITELLQEDDIWIKLSGADRVSRQRPSMQDGFELARLLFASRKDRCVWGSDFPHPNAHGFMPRDSDLVNGLATIAPTPGDLAQLLVANPTACFNFAPIPTDEETS